MIERGPATEDDMVLAFLRAEINSPRFGPLYKQCFDQLRPFGVTQQMLLDNADLGSPLHNRQRIEILKAVRGYRGNNALFTGFPEDAKWRRVDLEPSDWIKTKYANYPTWVTLSGGTRIVAHGAHNINSIPATEDANKNIEQIVTALKNGRRYPELIGVDADNGEIVLVEGHSRATAYILARFTEPVPCIIGSSPMMNHWAFY